MNKVLWKGVYPALLTPFTLNDEIDYEVFHLNLKAQLEAGVDGIIVAGSLGEASTMSNDEKYALVKFSRSVLSSDIPVILNIAEQSTSEAVKMAIEGKNAGADGLMMLPPMRYKADDQETVTYFKAIAAATDLPIMIYNNPVDYAISVTLDMFEQLAECPTIQAVKESSRQVSNITKMINRFGDRFKILCGVDPLALECLMLGADGWVAGLVDAFPRETVAIYRLAKAGRYEEALKIYRWFLPVLDLDIHPKLVQYIKLAATLTGISTEMVRAPRLVIEGEERERVLGIIQDGIASRPELPDYLSISTEQGSGILTN